MSKLDKLRRDPALFFRDSRWSLVRRAGEIAAPLWTDRVREILLDPRRALAADTVPVLSGVARIFEDRAAGDRRAAIEAAGAPMVSVIMAARDAARTIDAAIASVVDQSHEGLELIVVDDGSGDDTRAALERWAARDVRIALLANPESRGAAMARNRGLARAAGDFVAFHDADDVSDPERLERQIAPLLDGAAVMSVCNSARVDEAGNRVAVNDRSVAKATISMVFRRAPVLERIGYLRPLRVSEDAEYYERIKAAFGPGAEVVIHTALLAQRFSPGSLLFSDGTTERDGDRVAHRRSADADRAWAAVLASIDRIRAGLDDPYVDYDPEAPE